MAEKPPILGSETFTTLAGLEPRELTEDQYCNLIDVAESAWRASEEAGWDNQPDGCAFCLLHKALVDLATSLTKD